MFTLSDETKKHIDHWLKKYPDDQRRSAVVASLLAAQTQNDGYLSDEAMQAVADYLKISHVEAYEVATFYDMFRLKKMAQHKIAVCTNVSCMLRGSEEIINYLKETKQNEKFFWCEVECLAACGGAPMCQIDDKHYHENLTVEKIKKLIEGLN